MWYILLSINSASRSISLHSVYNPHSKLYIVILTDWSNHLALPSNNVPVPCLVTSTLRVGGEIFDRVLVPAGDHHVHKDIVISTSCCTCHYHSFTETEELVGGGPVRWEGEEDDKNNDELLLHVVQWYILK